MKHIHRFFISQPIACGQIICLEKDDAFHAGRVLRLKDGDAVELAGSDGSVFAGRIVGRHGMVEAEALAEIGAAEKIADLTVVQALPKGRKLDFVVEKLSEIGVARLAPVYTARSVARHGGGHREKLVRWHRIARSAASQSRRPKVMEVQEPAGLRDWLEGFTGGVIVLSTETAGSGLGDVAVAAKPPLALVVGPEAGFADDEIGLLKAAGGHFAGLGSQILRTETAALVAASIVLHRLGSLG